MINWIPARFGPSLGFGMNGCTRGMSGGWGCEVECADALAVCSSVLPAAGASSQLSTANSSAAQQTGQDGSCRWSCHPVMGTEGRRHCCPRDTEWWDVPFLSQCRAALCLTWAKEPQVQPGAPMVTTWSQRMKCQPVPVMGEKEVCKAIYRWVRALPISSHGAKADEVLCELVSSAGPGSQ